MQENITPQMENQLERLKDFFFANYEAATTVAGSLQLSTNEILERLHAVVDEEILDKSTLVAWLTEGNFVYQDMGNMKLLWIIKPRQK